MSARHFFAVLSAAVALTLHAGLQTGHFAEKSSLANGLWVKIAVDSCGVYKISHQQLRALGFDRPEKVSVRGFGACRLSDNIFSDELPDDLPPARFKHTPDCLLFYGEGAVCVRANADGEVSVARNLYDTHGYYFLSDQSADETNELITDHSVFAVEYVEHETFNPGRGGAIYHDEPLNNEVRYYGFNISDLAVGGGAEPVTLRYEFAAKSERPFAPEVILPNGVRAETVTVRPAEVTMAGNRLYTTGYGEMRLTGINKEGRYDIGFAIAEGETPKYAAIDRAWIIYPRNRQSGGIEEYRQPEIVGKIGTQNLHGHTTPEAVIITTENLKSAAEELAEIHRVNDGTDVRVVTQDEIFNEFSSGSRNAHAIRLYLKMLCVRQPGRLRNVIMYGRSCWDRRSAVERASLICYEAERAEECADENRNYVSDKYFAMLEDDFDPSRPSFGRMSLNVGRIDVNNEEEGRHINEKIRHFINRRKESNVYANVVMFSDSGDEDTHLLDVEDKIALMSSYNPRLSFGRIHSSAYRLEGKSAPAGRKALAEALKQGCGLMVYCGHSSPNALGSDALYDATSAKQNHYDDIPFALISSCETFGFDRNSVEIAKAMLNSDSGGAIGVIGACRDVYMDLNRSMADAIVERYALARPETTIGDIVREAHNYCIMAYKDEARATNAMCFNLCGDPMLKVGTPDARIIIETIDGRSIENVATLAVNSSRVRISGRIDRRDDFTGTATIKIYDRPEAVTTRSGKVIIQDQRILAEYGVSVADGRFETDIIVPEASEGEGANRIFIAAISDDGAVRATGVCNAMAIINGGVTAESSAPRISVPEVDIINVSGKDIWSVNTVISSTIDSEDGLRTGRIGQGVTVTIDGHKRYSPTVRAVGEGSYSVVCEIEGLSAGRHSATVTATSHSGAIESVTTDFIIASQRVECRLACDSSLVRDRVVIELAHDFSDDPTGRLIVFDDFGRTVFSVDNCSFPFVWDLRGCDGKRVADGRYSVVALLHDSFDFGNTGRLEITVID